MSDPDARPPRPPRYPGVRDHVARRCGIATVECGRRIPHWATCHYCGARKPNTRDHVVAERHSGTRAWWNLVPACGPCNVAKGTSRPATAGSVSAL